MLIWVLIGSWFAVLLLSWAVAGGLLKKAGELEGPRDAGKGSETAAGERLVFHQPPRDLRDQPIVAVGAQRVAPGAADIHRVLKLQRLAGLGELHLPRHSLAADVVAQVAVHTDRFPAGGAVAVVGQRKQPGNSRWPMFSG